MIKNSCEAKEHNDSVQNRFTAYLLLAVKRRKQAYMEDKMRKTKADKMINYVFNPEEFDLDSHIISRIPLHLQIENDKLFNAVLQLSDREKYIFLQHTLCQASFNDIALELQSSYKSVSTVFYRAMKKIQDYLRRVDNEF